MAVGGFGGFGRTPLLDSDWANMTATGGQQIELIIQDWPPLTNAITPTTFLSLVMTSGELKWIVPPIDHVHMIAVHFGGNVTIQPNGNIASPTTIIRPGCITLFVYNPIAGHYIIVGNADNV